MAKKYIEAGRRAGEDPEAVFMLVTESEELASRIRGMLGLEALPEQHGGAPKLKKPRLALLDIPSDGAYYLAPESTSVTGDAVEAFLADYKAGKLERKQLS